ncbi:hypothetical protein ACFE04_018322 [Oxalis oulophora]
MDPPENKTQVEGELRDSTLKKTFQLYSFRNDRVVEFEDVEEYYQRLNIECSYLEQSIENRKKYYRKLVHQEEHKKDIDEILALKNEKLFVDKLKALNRSNKQSSGKHPRLKVLEGKNIKNLQILMQHPIKNLRSEKKILKGVNNEQPRDDDIIQAWKSLGCKFSCKFRHIIGCDCWRGYNKAFIEPQLKQEIEAISDRKNTWWGYINELAPDDQIMKLLMKDTTRLICIIKEVTEKELVVAVNAKIKDAKEERDKEIALMQNQLANLELRKPEVEKIMSN